MTLNVNQLDTSFLTAVAVTIRDSLIATPEKFDRKIFLCGAGTNRPGSARDRIASGLQELSEQVLRSGRRRPWYDYYDIYYPETLFDGLMTGPDSYDLLTLENLLTTRQPGHTKRGREAEALLCNK